ncbi:hypothetical protein D3C72_2186000 [compost metagenome]
MRQVLLEEGDRDTDGRSPALSIAQASSIPKRRPEGHVGQPIDFLLIQSQQLHDLANQFLLRRAQGAVRKRHEEHFEGEQKAHILLTESIQQGRQ